MIAVLSEVAEVKMGFTFRSRLENEPDGAWAVIQMKDIDNENRLRTDQLTHIQTQTPAPKQVVQSGDLIFRSRGQNNTAAMVDGDLKNVILAAPLLMIRPMGSVLPSYLQWWINHPAGQAALSGMAEGTSVRMISKDSLEKLSIPTPPISIQEQVVAIAELVAKEQELLSRIALLTKHRLDALLLRIVNYGEGVALANNDSNRSGKKEMP